MLIHSLICLANVNFVFYIIQSFCAIPTSVFFSCRFNLIENNQIRYRKNSIFQFIFNKIYSELDKTQKNSLTLHKSVSRKRHKLNVSFVCDSRQIFRIILKMISKYFLIRHMIYYGNDKKNNDNNDVCCARSFSHQNRTKHCLKSQNVISL